MLSWQTERPMEHINALTEWSRFAEHPAVHGWRSREQRSRRRSTAAKPRPSACNCRSSAYFDHFRHRTARVSSLPSSSSQIAIHACRYRHVAVHHRHAARPQHHRHSRKVSPLSTNMHLRFRISCPKPFRRFHEHRFAASGTPGQLDQMMADNIAGGAADPAEINEMRHASAAALLDRVHHTQDAELVERVLTLVDREGGRDRRIVEPCRPRLRCRAFCGDCICCVRGCGRTANRSRGCGASASPSPPPPRRLPAWTRHRRKTTSHVPPIRFWPARLQAILRWHRNRAAAFTDVVALGLRIEDAKLVSAGGSSEDSTI